MSLINAFPSKMGGVDIEVERCKVISPDRCIIKCYKSGNVVMLYVDCFLAEDLPTGSIDVICKGLPAPAIPNVIPFYLGDGIKAVVSGYSDINISAGECCFWWNDKELPANQWLLGSVTYIAK